MCGLTGYYSFNNSLNKEYLVNMTDTLRHRGPDASGYFVDNIVGLGHRRLSIIDLSESANQPIFSHCGRYVIVYNGEIYNFKEIALELNLNCQTSSDTEVIIEAFALKGLDFVNMLNGMFVIVIYDKQTNTLYLFRDRIGIKPLFYYLDEKNFIFASELKALKKLDFIKNKLSINNNAINDFLHIGYIPEPYTIYNQINKFPSGSFAVVKNNNEKINFSISKYWDIDEKISKSIITDEFEAKGKLKSLLEKSVKYRMISDVPFGTFLSGGIDSSLVTAIAQSLSSTPIKTFSIGFNEAKNNESQYARNIANYLKTDHHEFVVSYKNAIDLIPDIFEYYDEPYADSSAIPTMLVSKLAKEYVTMTLSGDGGDELFHGYGAYLWANRLDNTINRLFGASASCIFSKLSNKYKRVSHLLKYVNKEDIKSHIFSQEQYYFSKSEINSLRNTKCEFLLNEKLNNFERKLNPAESQALFDIKNYLKDDLLVKVDRASMKYSLETRVPLLDYNIVEFALNVSPHLKIKNGEQKYLLKQVLYDYIPKDYFNRPKWGFSIPLDLWLKNELFYLIEENLSKQIVETYGLVNYKMVKELIEKYQAGDTYLYNRIWLLIVLHKWFVNNNI